MPLMMTPSSRMFHVHFHDALCALLNTLFSARGGYHDVYDNYQLLFSLVLLIYPDLSTPYVDPPFLYTTFAYWLFSQISERPHCSLRFGVVFLCYLLSWGLCLALFYVLPNSFHSRTFRHLLHTHTKDTRMYHHIHLLLRLTAD